MPTTQLQIDGHGEDPASVRFIFQKDPTPGGHEYELRLAVADIDSESIECAEFVDDLSPSEQRVRDWMFWLGHIVSRIHDPEACAHSAWVVNNILALKRSESELLVRGICSKWLGASVN
jgi:hypothetical protein